MRLHNELCERRTNRLAEVEADELKDDRVSFDKSDPTVAISSPDGGAPPVKPLSFRSTAGDRQ